jgi:hypothetical protein
MQPDRFAREIVAILALSYAARSRQLNGKPLDGGPPHSFHFTSASLVQQPQFINRDFSATVSRGTL